jgi:hypothetical protein
MALHLTPLWEAQPGRWDFAMASHLLRRAGFGGTLQEVDTLVQLGPEKAVASIVQYSSIKDDLPDLQFGEMTAPGMGRGRGMGRGAQAEIVQKMSPQERRAFQQVQNGAQRAKEQELRLWWLDRMVRTRRPLEEKMTLFWHGLLVSSVSTVRISSVAALPRATSGS